MSPIAPLVVIPAIVSPSDHLRIKKRRVAFVASVFIAVVVIGGVVLVTMDNPFESLLLALDKIGRRFSG